MRDSLHRRTDVRALLLALGGVALLGGLWSGMLRLGWPGPILHPQLPVAHGPLMVCGFLGTVISLERAVALRRTWAFGVPLLCGVGGILALAGLGGRTGPALITAGSAGLIVVFGRILTVPAVPFVLVMTGGAAAWAIGNGLWLAGWPIARLVPWWIGFLVLTIAGERLELSRMLGHRAWTKRVFLGILGVLGGSLVASLWFPTGGFRGLGLVLSAVAAWLLVYDVARRTIRRDGLPRFTAVCLLLGYGWLAAAGVLAVIYGNPGAGPIYDAILHAVFVGFVFSMIFGHAPVIVPSVLGVSIPFRRWFYGHVGLLHVGLLVRVTGDLAAAGFLRTAGGWLNTGAIVLFITASVASALHSHSDSADGSPSLRGHPLTVDDHGPPEDEVPDLQPDAA